MADPSTPTDGAGADGVRDALSDLLAGARRARQRLARTPPAQADATPEALAAQRLDASVIRPLAEALGDAAAVAGGAPDHGEADPAALVAELARQATRLRCEPGMPSRLREATAALQDLARRFADGEGPATGARAVAELERLQRGLDGVIEVQADGPYLVTNARHLRTWLGEELPTLPQMALCRCGASQLKPFCDGSHAAIGFSGAKDPDRVLDRLDAYDGQQITILDNRGTCQHSGFCSDRLATAFRVHEEPFVAPSGGRMDEIIRAVRDCPSGALSYAIDGVQARGQVDWDGAREPAIEVTKDGPYRISGAIALTDDGGGEVPRNAGASLEHYALCRCGHSQNKPFCSGRHWYVDFEDPVADQDRTPTVFEWCGGLPALTRMTRIFYEKHVPQDPLLAPLFATMSPDHPQRVAKWLSEVFGGPKRYSQEHGGYERMVSQHLGKGLTEEQRSRWVALMGVSAEEAKLPGDPEFRAAFTSYLEWGSRLAMENSQPGAKPPGHMPMPRWWWVNDAAPGTRVSALEPQADDEPPVARPGADEAVGFERHVKPLFRERDRRSMQFAFDLWSHDDVSEHADAILERLESGSMPCDGAWPSERVAVFARWVRSGRAA